MASRAEKDAVVDALLAGQQAMLLDTMGAVVSVLALLTAEKTGVQIPRADWLEDLGRQLLLIQGHVEALTPETDPLCVSPV